MSKSTATFIAGTISVPQPICSKMLFLAHTLRPLFTNLHRKYKKKLYFRFANCAKVAAGGD